MSYGTKNFDEKKGNFEHLANQDQLACHLKYIFTNKLVKEMANHMMEIQEEQNLGRVEEMLLRLTNRKNFIQILMSALDVRQIDIARKYGLHRSEICECIKGKNSNAKIRSAIASELGVEKSEIWPE